MKYNNDIMQKNKKYVDYIRMKNKKGENCYMKSRRVTEIPKKENSLKIEKRLKYAHIAIILLGIIFISIPIFHQNLWFDESYSVGMANNSFRLAITTSHGLTISGNKEQITRKVTIKR